MKFIISSSTQSVVKRYRWVTLTLALLAVVTVGLTVHAQNTTTTTVSCDSPVVVGQPGGCAAIVTDTASSGTTTPTGQVTFSRSGTGTWSFTSSDCTLSEITPGEARCSVAYALGSGSAGTSTITASYGGDGSHNISSNTATVTVNRQSTVTDFRGCVNGNTLNSSFSLNCLTIVEPTFETIFTIGATLTPLTGTVTFTTTEPLIFSPCVLSSAGRPTGVADCTVSISVSPASPDGPRTIIAHYSGDADHEPSDGVPFEVFVVTPDTFPPTITKSIGGPSLGSFVTSETAIRINVSDRAPSSGLGDCTISISGPMSTSFACALGDNVFTLGGKLSGAPDGTYTISATASDRAGNRATDPLTVRLDKRLP